MAQARNTKQIRDSRELDHEKQLLHNIRSGQGDALLEAVRLKNESVLQQLRQADQEGADTHPSPETWAQLLSHTDRRGQTALHYAISHGHRTWTFFLVKQGAPLDHGDKDGRTALHLAVLSKDKVFLLPFLLRDAPNLNVPDREQRTPLHWAASFGNEKACQLLLNPPTASSEPGSAAIADLNVQDVHGLTPLHLAVLNGHHTIVQLLLRPPEASLCSSANPNCTDHHGRSPLHAASYRAVNDRFLVIIRYLIEEGADIDHVDYAGRSPLFYATLGRSYLPAVELLVELGLNTFECDEKGRQALHYAAYHGRYNLINVLGNMGLDIELPDHNGQVPLHASVRHPELLRHFMNSGVSLMVEDDHGHLPLHLALMGGHEDSFFPLLAACPDFPLRSVDRFGRSLLHYAAWSNTHGVLPTLLELTGPSFFSMADHQQRTFVHVAAMRGHLAFLQRAHQILSEHLSPEQLSQLYQERDALGRTPLFYAAAKGTSACCHYLHELHDSLVIDMVDGHGRTLLHWAAAYGNLQTLQWITELDEENLMKRDQDGALPLHLAAMSNSTDAVELLLELAAELTNWSAEQWRTEEDHQKRTVLFYARSKAMLEFLVNAGWSVGDDETPSLLHMLLLAPSLHAEPLQAGLQYLFQVHKLSPTVTDDQGVTPFHLAAHSHSPSLLQMMLQFVPAKKAASLVDQRGQGLLFYACARANLPCLEYLCSLPEFSLDRRDYSGRSLLDTAAFLLHTPVVKFLLDQRQRRQRPMCFMKPASNGRTPLHAAVYAIGKRDLTSDHSQLLTMLLEAGFDINAEDHAQRSALYRAVFWRNATTASFLLQKGASVESVDDKGRSLLMVASAGKAVDCIKLLLASGAQVERQDPHGQTAMDYWQKAHGSVQAPAFPSCPKLASADQDLNDWVTFEPMQDASPQMSPMREVDDKALRDALRERDEANSKLAQLQQEVADLKKRSSVLSVVIKENQEQEQEYLKQIRQFEIKQEKQKQGERADWERLERQNQDQVQIIGTLRQDLKTAEEQTKQSQDLQSKLASMESELAQSQARSKQLEEKTNTLRTENIELKTVIFHWIALPIKEEYHKQFPTSTRHVSLEDLFKQLQNEPLPAWEELVRNHFYSRS